MKQNYKIQVILNFEPANPIIDLNYCVIEEKNGRLTAIIGLWHVLERDIHDAKMVLIAPTDKGYYDFLGFFDNEWFCQGHKAVFKRKWMG